MPQFGTLFDEAGFLIVAGRAVHERSFFSRDIESDPLSRYYYGRLECPYINQLCDEFDRMQEDGEHSPANPVFIIDPARNEGLTREHPFAERLLDRPAELVEELIAAHRKELKEKEQSLESKQLRKRLSRLERLVGDFIREELHGSADGGTPAPLPPSPPVDLEIIPTGFTLEKGATKYLTFRAPASGGKDEVHGLRLMTDSDAIKLESCDLKLKHDPERGYLHTTAKLVAQRIENSVLIHAEDSSGRTAQAVGKVVPPREEQMQDDLEFERTPVSLRANRPQQLRLLASKDVVQREGTRVHLRIPSTDFDVKNHHLELTPTKLGNYEGRVRVVGKRVGAHGSLYAKLGGAQAMCELRVRGKELPKGSVSIRLVDKDLGIYRAQFSRDNSNLLEITARHDSVGRYLRYDETTGEWIGQDSPHFRILMAEIVAETIARRMIISASANGSSFSDVARQTHAQYEIFNKLLPQAHRIMVPQTEASAMWHDKGRNHKLA